MLLAAALSVFSAVLQGAAAIAVPGGGIAGNPTQLIKPYLRERAPLQDIVTWDNQTLFIRGERVMIYSGEFHPFRLPVPTLWLDVLQKIKAMGYNCVSFYVHWALLEGTPGDFRAEGALAWEPFFQAASDAGIYLIARPGPYINAEATGGGFPGWLQRVKGRLRTSDGDYMAATRNYMAEIGRLIAPAQITNGGPVILFQPENEYTEANAVVPEFPDGAYMQEIEDAFREAGIVVPYISNDARPAGHNAPGSGAGEVDIYGHDGYPLGFDCANPYTWPNGNLPTTYRSGHMKQSPLTPYSVVEFQGGSFDPWGGLGFEQCSVLINHEFERVFYKNMFASGVTIFNIYMTYGGTNWGNLGHPGGYTSYDYGSVLREDRRIDREKYSEAKLESIFITSTRAYMTSAPQAASTNYTTAAAELTVTPLFDGESGTRFWVLRHTAYNSLAKTAYKLTIPTSAGWLTIPRAQGRMLSLDGRDSKVHVTDLDVGGYTLRYSSAEIFTVKKFARGQTHLVVYGGPGEFHELAFSGMKPTTKPELVEGASGSVSLESDATGAVTIGFTAGPERRIVQVTSDLFVHLLDRNTAYNYWLPSEAGAFDHSKALLVAGGYLIRNAKTYGTAVYVNGDMNATTTLEVFGAPANVKYLYLNGKQLATSVAAKTGALRATVLYQAPKIELPDVKTLDWRYTDSLPELSANYDDSKWTVADHPTTNNPLKLSTPTSLYASDYGYHTGSLIYRGHYTSLGNETVLKLRTAGGSAYGMSAWLNGAHIGSWPGNDKSQDHNSSFPLPPLAAGTKAVLTVAIDHMGLNQNWVIGTETMKFPRGILDFEVLGREKKEVTWKLTGNLGGEEYVDKWRGPLNEGGVYAERQGWHLPGAPTGYWAKKTPFEGVEKAGVGFFTTSFKLNLPKDYDIPLAFTFANMTSETPNYRAHLYVNGWQYGKYVHNVGPQDTFPVPQGILNHQGTNYLAVSLWALDTAGAKLGDVSLTVGTSAPPQWRYSVETVKSPRWEKRAGAY